MHTQTGFGKGKMYVEMMIEMNTCIFIVLNKEQKPCDIGTNGQILTLANTLLRDYA